MTRTRTADNDPQLPDDDDDIHVGDDVKGHRNKSTSTTPSRSKLGLPPRKRGRPAGPPRVPMNVRVLLETDRLVTEIGEELDMGPQQIADAAIAHYAAHLRRTGRLPKKPLD
ncbi:hypothetical protein ABZ569_33460 [Streptomyces albus]|uniref:hypothetical protein n=1 Tax=Streptomyces albus TaxID=1888 RepID=UPI0033E7252D